MRHAVVLMVALGVMITMCVLAVVALTLMTNESRIAEDKIRRMRRYYAAQAGAVYEADRIRREGQGDHTETISVGPGASGYPAGGIPVNIDTDAGSGIDGTDRIRATATY